MGNVDSGSIRVETMCIMVIGKTSPPIHSLNKIGPPKLPNHLRVSSKLLGVARGN